LLVDVNATPSRIFVQLPALTWYCHSPVLGAELLLLRYRMSSDVNDTLVPLATVKPNQKYLLPEMLADDVLVQPLAPHADPAPVLTVVRPDPRLSPVVAISALLSVLGARFCVPYAACCATSHPASCTCAPVPPPPLTTSDADAVFELPHTASTACAYTVYVPADARLAVENSAVYVDPLAVPVPISTSPPAPVCSPLVPLLSR
jgi:hypothetical protein